MERFKNWLANRAFDVWMRLTPDETDSMRRERELREQRLMTLQPLSGSWREQDQPPVYVRLPRTKEPRLRPCHCPVMTGGAIHHWPDCPQGMTPIPQGIRKSMES